MTRKSSKKTAQKKPVKSGIKTAAKKAVKHAVKKVVKKVAKKIAKRVVKKAVKKVLISSADKATLNLKATVKSLPKDVLEWVNTHHGEEAVKVAVEKFGVNYAHLTDWLKKEGVQVKQAVGSLIESHKNDAIKKGEGKLKELAKSIQTKKMELKKLAGEIKMAAKRV